MKIASDTAPAAPSSVAAGADSGERVRELRRRAGLTQRELGQRAGCDGETIGGLERGEKVPSVELAERVARALGARVGELFGEPSECECECGLLTFSRFGKGHYHPGPAARRKQGEALEAYKREHSYLGTAELERATGRRQSSLARDVRHGRLDARVYPGEWNGHPPLLFDPAAIARVRRIQTVERRRSYVARALAHHADRRARGLGGTKPARGETRECPLPGCDKLVYLHPSEDRAGYCSVSHAVLARFIDGRVSSRLYEHWQGGRDKFERSRADKILSVAKTLGDDRGFAWLGKYAPVLAAANGKKVGAKPRLASDEKERVRELAAKGKSGRAIARIVTAERRDRDPRAKAVSPSTVHRELRAYHARR